MSFIDWWQMPHRDTFGEAISQFLPGLAIAVYLWTGWILLHSRKVLVLSAVHFLIALALLARVGHVMPPIPGEHVLMCLIILHPLANVYCAFKKERATVKEATRERDPGKVGIAA